MEPTRDIGHGSFEHVPLGAGGGQRWQLALLAFVLCVGSIAPQGFAEQFPLRSTYSDVAWISTADLEAEYGRSTIIDVRSELEFDVIHVKGAINVPVARSDFDQRLREVVKDGPAARLIFYCNGHTCAKSYKAARQAAALGYTDTVAYDAGIFDWTRAHPDKAVLVGESPVDPANLVSDEMLRSHQKKPADFIAGAQADDVLLIDVRDPIQRKMTPDFGEKPVANYYMTRLAKLLSQPTFRDSIGDRDLYIFDAAGKQVRWLQYLLEKDGYTRYTFLEGGVWSVFGSAGAN